MISAGSASGGVSMLVGLDFDNTIAGYDSLFLAVAREEGLVPEGTGGWTKKRVRDHIRRHTPDGETAWQRLQGRVYGARMDGAELIDGVPAFLSRCRSNGVPVAIVSHKTEYGHFDSERVNLRDAARRWMTARGFFDPDGFALDPAWVFFEGTRASKIARIRTLGCTHFVDDLEEVLREPGFPETTHRYLFAGGQPPLPDGPFRAFTDWTGIADDILGIG